MWLYYCCSFKFTYFSSNLSLKWIWLDKYFTCNFKVVQRSFYFRGSVDVYVYFKLSTSKDFLDHSCIKETNSIFAIVKHKNFSINKISLYWKWTWRGSPNWVNSVLSNLCMWLYDYFSFWVHLFAIHLSLKWNWLDKYFTCNCKTVKWSFYFEDQVDVYVYLKLSTSKDFLRSSWYHSSFDKCFESGFLQEQNKNLVKENLQVISPKLEKYFDDIRWLR